MKKRDEIYQTLRRDIISGQLLQGERITEFTLTEKFNCSRASVREALVQLARQNFISLMDNKGAVVSKISAKDVEEYYSLLEILEGYAVELATPNININDINRLEIINNSFKNINTEDENFLEEWCIRNSAFHNILREKSGNEKIDWIVSEIRNRIFRYRYSSLINTIREEYINDHYYIIDCIRKKNALMAKNAMQTHIKRAKNILLKFLNQAGGY